MTDAAAAVGMDRLPWLPDEPARAPNRTGGLVAWAAAAILLVAGTSYWLGTRSGPQKTEITATSSGRPGRPMVIPLSESMRL